jgi:putative ATP-dependent endonuclease of the OLD family
MKLSRLDIRNFRGIQTATIFFGEHSVLLGQNDSGKSAVIDAIGVLLGRDRLARTMGDYDFYGGDPQPQDRILIKGLLTGFTNDEPQTSPDWFNDNSGGIPVWYNPHTKEIHKGERIADTVLGVEIAFCARFDVDDLEYESMRYFFTENNDPFEDTAINLLKNYTHLKELGFYLLPAKRTWDRTMTFNSELFRRVLKFQEAIPGQTVLNLRNDLRNDENRIEEQEPLNIIIGRLNLELSGFITDEGRSITFLPNQGDVQGVLDNLTPFIEADDGFTIPIGKHGSGLISLQTLLLLLEFGRYRNEIGYNFFLCAEEPELHLQPGLHGRLVGRIRGLGNQTITTTHSPEIATYYKPNEILILNNRNGVLKVTPLLQETESLPAANSLMRLYTLYRKDVCEALMNKKIILPEGLTDFRWMKILISASTTAEGWDAYNTVSDRTKSFGIIPTQNSHVVGTYSRFRDLIEDAIPLVDGDAAGRGYVTELLALENSPRIILSFGYDRELEDLISWVVHPEIEGRLAELEEILIPFEGQSLKDFLHRNKQHWGFQDSLADYIIRNEDCVRRARLFVNSIYSIDNLEGDYALLWTKDEQRSNETTVIYNFLSPIL